MYQTRNYSSHNPGHNGILLRLSVDYICVHEIIHDNKIVDISGDDGRHVFRSQETTHSYFQKRV